jgi:hypothetical protein
MLNHLVQTSTKLFKLQVAGGLHINSSSLMHYRNLLVPSANMLLLTGDCLTPERRENNHFLRYLEDNWPQVIYIHGDTELKCPGSITNGYKSKSIIHAHKNEIPLGKGPNGNLYTLLSTSYSPWFDPPLLNSDEHWLYDYLRESPGISIVASYGEIPFDVLTGNISAIIQGSQTKNQFDPKNGPITNNYKSADGTLQMNYSPSFTLQFKS